MSDYTFELNGKDFTTLVGLSSSYIGFSGNGPHRNNPDSIAVPDGGPIPLGQYYIVDRQSGGRLGWLWDLGRNVDQWFALYRDDGTIDDTTYINSVRRGEFRLHPLGPSGISTGCIVIQDPTRFSALRAELLGAAPRVLPQSTTRTYGTVSVVPKGILLPPLLERRGSPDRAFA